MLDNILALLEKREFLSVATSDLAGHPNAAPKFVLKADSEHLYLVDYVMGTTYNNLKSNPRVSMSFLDPMTLKGYQLNGSVRIIETGKLYEKLRDEMLAKEVRLTTERIIQDVRGEAHHETFEVELAENYVIFEVTIEEVVEISPGGVISRKKKGL